MILWDPRSWGSGSTSLSSQVSPRGLRRHCALQLPRHDPALDVPHRSDRDCLARLKWTKAVWEPDSDLLVLAMNPDSSRLMKKSRLFFVNKFDERFDTLCVVEHIAVDCFHCFWCLALLLMRILVALKHKCVNMLITVVLLLDLGCSRFKFTHCLIVLCTVFRIRIMLFLSAANKFFYTFYIEVPYIFIRL